MTGCGVLNTFLRSQAVNHPRKIFGCKLRREMRMPKPFLNVKEKPFKARRRNPEAPGINLLESSKLLEKGRVVAPWHYRTIKLEQTGSNASNTANSNTTDCANRKHEN